MKVNLLILITLFINPFFSKAQQTPYELKGKNYTATYEECMDYYRQLDKKFSCISLQEMGMTDAGEPLHVVMINKHGRNDPDKWHQKNKLVILINNGIHPGEPDGIDACMMLVRDIAERIEEESENGFPENIALAVIPVYNIGGCLNRSEFNRVDQNGPQSFGARGNSRNLDLNRDFIKCDSREAQSFAEIFHWIQPDIFMDTHVSDGADYQYVMTLASTQYNKLGGEMGKYLNETFEPALFERMRAKSYPTIPYVNAWGWDAREGWSQFFDGPRYSSGYAALFNVFSFTLETHMLKPYDKRVDATYKFIETMIDYCAEHADTIRSLRRIAAHSLLQQKTFPIAWQHDKNKFTELNFQGYAYKTTTSKVSGLPVKYYDRNEPYTEKIKFYNTYTPSVSVQAPAGYIIPQTWSKIIDLLILNNVEMVPFDEDTTTEVEAYTIKNYQSSATPYEAHHANNNVEVENNTMMIEVKKGDYYISLNQPAKRFIIEVLEPQGSDSYFSWNFFDGILIQKEGYSDYAYEEYAAEYLQQHTELQTLLNEKRNADTAFARDASAQLDFVYKHSPYAEKAYKLYPVYRVMNSDQQENENMSDPGRYGIRNKEDE